MNTIEMHERTAAVVRAAIESTLSHLEGLDAGTQVSDMLVAHLGTLLEFEVRMLAVVPHDDVTLPGLARTVGLPVAPAEEKPWYPDGGQWVETHGVDPELSDLLLVQALSKNERQKRKHSAGVYAPSVLSWPDIVAYKVVRS